METSSTRTSLTAFPASGTKVTVRDAPSMKLQVSPIPLGNGIPSVLNLKRPPRDALMVSIFLMPAS